MWQMKSERVKAWKGFIPRLLEQAAWKAQEGMWAASGCKDHRAKDPVRHTALGLLTYTTVL